MMIQLMGLLEFYSVLLLSIDMSETRRKNLTEEHYKFNILAVYYGALSKEGVLYTVSG